MDLCVECRDRLAAPLPGARTLRVSGGHTVNVTSHVVATDEVLRLITAYKDESQSSLAVSLASLAPGPLAVSGSPVLPLSERLRADPMPNAPWVVVPQTAAAYRRRGWHPLHRLVRAWGARPAPWLEFERMPREQSRLGRGERSINVHGSMRVRSRFVSDVRGAPHVLLVDDVITTGATLSEAARALFAAGATSVSAVTLASVPFSDNSPKNG